MKTHTDFLDSQKQSPRGIVWKSFHKNFAKFTGKKPASESLFNKVATFFKNETLTHVFSHEYCEISMKSSFCRTLLVAVRKHLKQKHSTIMLHGNV